MTGPYLGVTSGNRSVPGSRAQARPPRESRPVTGPYLGAGWGEGARHSDQNHPLALAEVAGLDGVGRRVLEEGRLGKFVSDLCSGETGHGRRWLVHEETWLAKSKVHKPENDQ